MTAAVDEFLGIDNSNEVRRDARKRPYIKQPGTGKEITYTRCSTFAKELDETYMLGLWQQRMTAIGLADRPDLLLAVAAHRDDRSKLNGICDEARAAAGAGAKATIGTALHAFTEQHDLNPAGFDLACVPAAHRADIAAYIEATAGFDMRSVETFGVCDDIRVAGSWDRIMNDGGRSLIGDIKSGSIGFGIGAIAMQLAIYAHCKKYNPATGEREALDVDLRSAVIIHLPQGEGRCELVDVDIEAGWEAVQLALEVKKWRKRKDLSRPFDRSRHWLAVAIEQTTTIDELAKVWLANQPEWNNTLTAIARSHKRQLELAEQAAATAKENAK